MTLQEFLAWLPETGRYELHDGMVVEMQPTGAHEQVVGLLNRKFNVLLEQENLNYFIPNTVLSSPWAMRVAISQTCYW
ncbi:Uma2 family endonuclease [Leptolyngbya subtilissima]|uniref:Uma2 family endonuclease n=2 Tax=Cyanophyceae TaxID=3028117 RepID=UPI003D6589BB